MKCQLEKRWETDTVKVWLYEQGPGRQMRLYQWMGDDRWQFEDVAEGLLPGPTMELPGDALAAIAAEASAFLPPSEAQGKHLEDAVQVRDRLLTMFEKRGVR